MAPPDPHLLLRDAIAAAARRDPDRVALAGGEESRTYGELALLLEGGGDSSRREALTVGARVADVETVLRASLGGASLLLLDANTTTAEAARAEAVFTGEDAAPGACLGLSTSGSSGLPKVVELDWESLLLNAAAFARAGGYGSGDVVWCTTPPAHLYCFGAGVLAGLLSGATVLLTDGMMSPAEFAATARRERATVLLSVPFLFRRYLDAFEADGDLAATWSVCAAVAAGEPVPPELIEAWRRASGVSLQAHYGLTEGGQVTLAGGDAGEGVGRPLEDVELRVGEGGEIAVRRRPPERPYRILGTAPDPDGWCETGDLGHLDEHGNLHVSGRADHRINFAGKKVDPTEVEQALAACDGVEDCAVAGLEGPGGERVAAFIRVDPAASASDGEIRAQLASRLSPYKLPRRFVRVERIPRTLTGKVRRGELIAGLAGEGAEQGPDRGDLLALVRGEAAAAVLGHGDAAAIDPDTSFRDLGFDSLAAVELRNRLGEATGLELPTTLAFDHPTPRSLAAFLGDLAAGRERRPVAAPAAVRSEEPVAIVGMSCRYPGGVDSPRRLWELVAAGEDGISAFPEDRGWDLERLFDPDPDHPGTSYVRAGGFLADVAGFDAEFFGIGPREARAMDPQQRLLLEAAWEAIEDAGVDPAALAGSATGVFAGVMRQDYWQQLGGSPELEAYQGVGSAGSVVSGRIAYSFGLEGPAVSVDTACSSSLVALHLAAQALRGGECELALAGGATVMSTPWPFIEFSRQRSLSPDGRCKSFDAAADGTGFAEGVGLVLLERLSDAERNGHQVLALIRGSATNQDGASNGLTAPSGSAQERVIRQALANAGLEPAEVDAVEAHGTGTVLGDPIEAGALLATYGQDREEAGPLALGSIKSNLGHTQAAAGVAGVIKMTMALRQGLLPRSLHLEEPTPHVDWSAGAVELLREPRQWERGERPRRAGVSSFGLSGTNAHLILEEAPVARAEIAAEPGSAPLPVAPLLLSAKSEEALRDQGRRLASHLRESPTADLADSARALAGRSRFGHRAAILAASPESPLAALDALAAGLPHAALVEGRADTGKLAFLCPGHGSQWRGMGRDLLAGSPLFAEHVRACEEALSPYLDFSLQAVLRGDAYDERVDVIQAALFAMTVSLAGLWRSFGVEPEAVLGHSQGEVVAAHVAGALSLEDAARVIALRSHALRDVLAGKGGMVALQLGAEQALELIEPWGERLAVGAINSPLSTVVTGDPASLEELTEACEAKEVRARRLALDCASHGPQAEAIRERLLEGLAPISPRPAEKATFYSAMTGEPLAGEELGASYWYESMRSAVRFGAGVESLLGDGFTAFLEPGVHPVLIPALEENAAHQSRRVVTIGTLRREQGGLERFGAALAEADVHGVAVDRARLFAPGAPRRAELPTYPFQRRRYWLERSGNGGGEPAAVGQSDPDHPLLGATIALPGDGGWLLTGRLSLQSHPWLADHAVFGTSILPGTAFVEMARQAGVEAGAAEIAELTIAAPLVLPEQGAVQVQVSVGALGEGGERPLEIHSRRQDREAEWERNATGSLSEVTSGQSRALDEWPPAAAEPLEVEDFYERAARRGIEYGPAFQGLRRAWSRGEEIFAEVELGPEQAAEAGRFGLHPALLDAALHTWSLSEADDAAPRAPFAWRGIGLRQPGASALRVRLALAGGDAIELSAVGEDGAAVAHVASLALRPLAPQQVGAGPSGSDSLFGLEWVELEALPDPAAEEIETVTCSPRRDLDPAAAAEAICAELLAQLREAVADADRPPLAFLTEGAVAVAAGESPDPAAAAVWGLVRSAQAEHPDRFLLVDTDGSEASGRALGAALRLGEPQLALRDGVARAPRLARVLSSGEEAPAVALDPEGTVLLTGGTGALGAAFARHLVVAHGARHLLLVSRQGPAAAGAAELVAELGELGAEAEAVACDVADREQLRALLAALPAGRPLRAVIHAAGVLDDGLLQSLDPGRLATVMAPKAAAAWNLHELTAASELTDFVLFSSIAATVDSPGQGNYAAANAFLEALAGRRRGEGLPALALGWGAWELESEMAAHLGDAYRSRLARGGIGALSEAEGLELFDRARAVGPAQLFPVRLDRVALRAAARERALPAALRGLVRAPARAARGGSFAGRLAATPEAERAGVAMELVRAQVAAVLGHPSPAAIDPERPFKDLGFDSLAAVELRNRLGQATGLQLPATAVFDYPSPAELASFLRAQAEGAERRAPRPRAARAGDAEPIAIVGMSCRYPGGVRSPEDLWRLLARGGDAISGFPGDRGWDLERLFDPDPGHAGTSYAREGGFLAAAAEFDAGFFGVSPREALATDPQQRLLLEAAWEAFESAGIDPATVAGTAAGVFAGVMHHDYGRGAAPAELEAYQGVGAAGSVVSGRVAYNFGLEGPAVSVDTACSSSLVAMHLAAQALRSGECDLALAGGVTVMSTPSQFVEFSRQRGLAPDGRCKPFAAAADGTALSEGVGLLVLERLSDAEANGHEVLALIRGSAINQDGASNGLTAPNGPSQERVIRQALANAGIEASQVDAVEAHGTGTALGDPIEAEALLATYGQEREGAPLALGSVKSNLGHTQAAAGVAGVIKMTLALRHGALPRTIHLDEPSHHVDWGAGEVELLTEPRAWERGERPRRAGVSSFGISGTNAHLILEEAPAAEPAPSGDAAPPPVVPWLLSARSEAALGDQARRLLSQLEAEPQSSPLDVGFSLAGSRARFEHRAVAFGGGGEELTAALAALAAGRPHPGLAQGRARTGKLAFLFSGQGAQRPGMGAELYGAFPAFAAALDEVCTELDSHLERPLQEVLFAATGSAEAALLDRTEFTQPALFAIEVALFRLLEGWGLEPDFLIGHSIGELAAAHVAGVFGLADACKLIAARGALMGALPAGGAMVAIEAAEEELAAELPGELAIAAVNGPRALVVSGPEAAAAEFAESWRRRGRKTSRLRVSHAFHSALMEPMLTEFAAVAASLDYDEPRIPVLSNLSGEPLGPEQAADPAYWVAQVREPVRFMDGARHLAAQGVATFLELGPDGVLCAMAQGCLAAAGKEALSVPLLRRDRAEAEALLAALAAADCHGAGPDWRRFFAGRGARRVALPTYAFQGRRYWLEPVAGAADATAIGQNSTDHPLLGSAHCLPGEREWLFTGRLSLQAQPWLADHLVHGSAVLPGAVLAEMALHAGARAGAGELRELTMQAPLALPQRGAVQVQLSLGAPGPEGERSLAIHSRAEDADDPERPWAANAAGNLGPEPASSIAGLAEWPPAGAQALDVGDFYELGAGLGVEHGPAFRCVKAGWRRGEEIFAELELPAERGAEAERFGLHPALFDAALHARLLDGDAEAETRVPFAWNGVRLAAPGARKLRVRLAPAGEGAFGLTATDAAGSPVAAIESLSTRPLSAEQLGAAAAPDSLFELEWKRLELPMGSGGAEGETRRFDCVADRELDPAGAAQALCAEVLAVLREAIAAEDAPSVAFVTQGGMALGATESPDPAAAAVWGLVRSAQAEHPGRFLLIDSDGSEASSAVLARAPALAGEPQLALREGVASAPRLSRATEEEAAEPAALDPEKTVLITGATGSLGSLFARHLVVAHGARQLLLTSRRGPDAPGAAELARELEELGAEARLAACDVGDRAQLEALLGSVPAAHPLGAVVHCAGVSDDGLVDSLSAERLATTMGPKAGAAWHLHELTAGLDLSEFVLFSSVAATLGSPGQGNYAAANAFLDALAQRRRAEGLPAYAIEWGAWRRESELTAGLGAADRARIARGGVVPLADADGLRLFDRARRLGRPLLLGAALDRAALRSLARAAELPPLLSGLVRVAARPGADAAGSLARRLAELPGGEREGAVLELVREHVAALLGHPSPAAVDPEAPFKDLGFDSLAAVELRNRLDAATGLRLPATLVFDHPTTAAAAAFLRGLASGQGSAAAAPRPPRRTEEPIAIVGISCRYPGGVESPDDLWRLLVAGGDGITAFPTDRGWPLERLFDPDPDHPGTSYASEGGFLHDAAEFDAEFFGISPREAVAMDPQQRLLLEAAWEACEDAGVDPASLAGSATGVFAGVMHHDYGQGAAESELEGYQGVGAAGSVVSGRVAYSLGLEGPAVSVDTACSSSLVAMHLAAQALRSGECDLALAGGVTVMASPAQFVEFSRQRGLARDGRCKPFAAAADGTGWSEGVGLLLLERLSAAEANGHEVLALVRGSATNQDGASNGLTAPNGPSQERVIRQALANAGLDPAAVDAVEAHGTGTALGDPIEAGALLATYGQERDGAPLALGSVKSNLGHTQAAAGVAGVIKMTLALRHGVLPRSLHLEEPTPHVDWSAGAVEPLREPRAWERGERPRRAGVSSFGISGTNAHLILEEPPAATPAATPADLDALAPAGPVAWALSAKSERALREGASRLGAHLVEHPQLDPAAAGQALASGRAALEHRAVVVGEGREQLEAALAALAAGAPDAAVVQGRAAPGRLAFLFSGQGAQRAGMGRGLYEAFPVFAEAFDRTCAALEEELVPSVRAAVFAPADSDLARGLDRTDLTQASLFALQVALFRLASSFGIVPDYLIGHSIGEISAAHLAGVLSLEDAARLVAGRGRLMAELEEGGAMAAVRAGEAEVEASLAAFAGRLCIAAVNAPGSIVVSGDGDALAEWRAAVEADGHKTRPLRVSHAFHSHRVEPMLERFEALAAELSFEPPRIPIVSNLSGRELSAEEAASPTYWARHAREAVRFADGIAELDRAGVTRYLELGPDAVLSTLAAEILGEGGGALCASALRAKRADADSFLLAAGAVHADGGTVDWSPLFAPAGAGRAKLPTYPFQRRRYWLRSAGATDAGAIGQSPADHPLLGARLSLAGGEEAWRFSGRIAGPDHPWLADHLIHGSAIVPGSAFAELALHAGGETGADVLEEMTIAAPLALPEQGAVQIQVSVGAADEDGRRPLSIHSRPEGGEETGAEWTRHADGVLGPVGTEEPEGLGEWPPPGAEPVAVDDLYESAAELGLDYGPAFQGLKAAWRRGEELFAAVELGEEQAAEAERYGIHPALLDAALHASALGAKEEDALRVPFAWSGVRLFGSGATALRVRLAPAGEGAVSVSLDDASGAPALSIESLALRPLEASQLAASRGAAPDSLFAPEWIELPLPEQGGEGEIRRFECAPAPDLDPPAAALALCEQVLAALQEAIAGGEQAPLAFITEGALASEEGEAPDPAMAAARGLIRSAQAEHPGRFLLIDSDGSEASAEALTRALVLEGEPQLALRQGALLAPRLARAPKPEEEPKPIDPEGTVLITGASGTLGTLFARHLVSEHGARHLLLASRRGAEAPGAKELVEELSELGAQAELAACDVAERDQLAELIASVPPERPLRAVLHCAGLTDDGLVDSLDPERLQKTMAPKAEGAWHLHQLTKQIEGCELILFSSVAGTLQTPGQGNYAAANAFLDALAGTRKAEGLAALSLGWGAWQSESTLTARLSEADRARIARAGIAPLKEEEGLALFDRARAHGDPHLIAAKLDPAALRANARAGTLPALLSGLVRVPARRAAGAGSLAERLASVPEPEREALVLDLVRSHVAAVLAHPSASAIDPKAAFKELGFDSLAAVELRNRLGQATGLRLPATLVFDYPSAEAVAGYLRGEAEGTRTLTVAPTRATASEEPIAIVGISCRYPGGVGSPEELWQLLETGTDAISGFPNDRGWDLERLYDPDPDHPGTSYAREGGFLHDAAEFDAEFFGISPREALVTDPQQRLLLEGAWEAFEDAGIDPASLAGSDTGVFAGVMHHDYGMAGAGSGQSGAHQGAVASGSVISGRIAYTFGLEGPAVSVDTACSSSLVAMHLAAQALRSGECRLALAGGVTVMATPGLFVEFSRQRGLAPDGRCKSFAAAADGAGFSEGSGLLLLERLSDAQRNGHEVIALIRGSATNQDGASNGLTAPNGPAQERVIRRALANAGLSPAEVDAVEAHGTGTTLGDPIEAGAILATYGQGREGAEPLRLGSIKSNLGHAQAAAGVAGVIKMALALRHGVLPRSLNLAEPTPQVDWSAGAVELLREPREWQPGERPRRAGVSSFGISGTNAHLILEEAPRPEPGSVEPEPAPPIQPAPLILSAKSEPALREGAARLAAHLRANPELDRGALAATLAARARLPQRAAVLPAEAEELPVALDALAAGLPHAELLEGEANAGKLAFICPGQGSQWQGMGRELLESSPAFAAHVAACEEALAPYVDFSLEAVLRGDAHSERVEVIQPALFAMTVSLAALWRSHGVEPAAVLGHSQGEIAAAHLAGALSLEDAARVVALRSQALTELAGKGGMASLALPAEQAKERIAPWGQSLHLAAHNSPIASVVSGEPEALAELIAACEAAGVRARLVAVDYASHSAQVEAIAGRLAQELAPIAPGPAAIPFYSALSAGPLPGEELGAEYWYRSLREPVRFEAAIASLLEGGFGAFVELSAHPVLSMAVEECAAAHSEAPVAALGSLRREEGGLERFTAALAAAHVSGVEVDWAERLGAHRRLPLPGYPFQRRRYWLDSSGLAGGAVAAGQGMGEHPLLGAAISLPGGAQRWLLTARLSLGTHPWLADHELLGTPILPGTAFVELALKAAEQAGLETVEELTIEAPLVLPEQGAVEVHVSVEELDEAGRCALAVHSRPEEPEAEWVRNASGSLSRAAAAEPEDLGAWPPPGAERVPVDSFYEHTAALGIDYGPAFQGLKAAWRRGEEIFAEVELAEEQAEEAGRYGIHPALLDAAFHTAFLDHTPGAAPRVPFACSDVHLYASGSAFLRLRLSPAGPEAMRLDAADAAGAAVASVRAVAIRPIEPAQLRSPSARVADSIFDLQWIGLALAEGAGEAPPPRALREGLELAPGQPVPPWLLFECAPPAGPEPAVAAEFLCTEVLEVLQAAIADERLVETRLAFLTRGAMAVREGESPDPAAAAVWGLVRSAQAEHPGRFLLLDSDGSEASEAALSAALALEGEPQLALREGVASGPRLRRAATAGGEPRRFDPAGTVLVTGGTGAIGGAFARHLVAEHGVRRLVLTSRRGPDAPRAAELAAELTDLGAEVELAACDVGDRRQMAELIGSIPPGHPLTAVFHAAAVFDNGLIEALDPARLASVIDPKAGAAWHLHELTREMPGCELVLFSSIAGSFQNPGQGNYAAANAFLDALAAARRAEGLPAVALAWGLWDVERVAQDGGGLATADLARLSRGGIVEMSAEYALELFDRTRAYPDPFLVAARLDLPALRGLAREGALPPLLRGLVRAPARRAGGAAGSLAERLAGVPGAERPSLVAELVRSHVAAVLGHPAATAVDPEAPFKDLGFDSLVAVELRNRLARATGLRLPATLVFDHPTPAAVAEFLLGEVEGKETPADTDRKLEAIASILESIGADEKERALAHLRSLLTGLAGEAEANGDRLGEVDLDSASDEELLRLIDGEYGQS